MSTTLKLIQGSSASLTGTASLNSLASGSYQLLDEYDNGTNLWPNADFEFVLKWATGPTDNSQISLWIIPAEDGTNYADGSASVVPRANLSIGVLLVRNTTSSQRLVVRTIPLPACKFKIVFLNGSNQTTDSSGNSAKVFPYSLQSV